MQNTGPHPVGCAPTSFEHVVILEMASFVVAILEVIVHLMLGRVAEDVLNLGWLSEGAFACRSIASCVISIDCHIGITTLTLAVLHRDERVCRIVEIEPVERQAEKHGPD